MGEPGGTEPSRLDLCGFPWPQINYMKTSTLTQLVSVQIVGNATSWELHAPPLKTHIHDSLKEFQSHTN